jgi:hypothetical protein
VRLEFLYRIRYVYTERAEVTLEGGLEHYFLLAEGHCTGAVNGRLRGANHLQRRPDGTLCPDFHGVIETDEGGAILLDWRGYGRAYPAGRRQLVGAATHRADDERYRALSDAVCAIEGEVRARPDKSGSDLVLDVYELQPTVP